MPNDFTKPVNGYDENHTRLPGHYGKPGPGWQPGGTVDAGPDPLALAQEYGDIARTVAGHAALWAGGGALWDAKRKALWCAIAERIRREWSGDKAPAEKALETLAHSDEQYQRFILDAERTATEYHEAMARLREIEMIQEFVKSANYRACAEARLTP